MTPAPTVNVLSPTDLEDRRRELLASVGCSVYDLRDRAHDYALTIDELEILRELELSRPLHSVRTFCESSVSI